MLLLHMLVALTIVALDTVHRALFTPSLPLLLCDHCRTIPGAHNAPGITTSHADTPPFSHSHHPYTARRENAGRNVLPLYSSQHSFTLMSHSVELLSVHPLTYVAHIGIVISMTGTGKKTFPQH